jgi:hypothetical protein
MLLISFLLGRLFIYLLLTFIYFNIIIPDFRRVLYNLIVSRRLIMQLSNQSIALVIEYLQWLQVLSRTVNLLHSS